MGKNLGYNIRKIRELRGYKQGYVATALGIDKTSYGDIESGKTQLSLVRLDKIAEILETTRQAIEEYSDAKIFHIINNHCGSGSGSGYVTFQNTIEDMMKALETLVEPLKLLLADKDKQLASKDEEIQRLRN